MRIGKAVMLVAWWSVQLLGLTAGAASAESIAAMQERKRALARQYPKSAESRALISDLNHRIRQAKSGLLRSPEALQRELRAGLDPTSSNNMHLFIDAVRADQAESVRLMGKAVRGRKFHLPALIWLELGRSDNADLALAVVEVQVPSDWSRSAARLAISSGAQNLLAKSGSEAFDVALETQNARLAQQLLQTNSSGAIGADWFHRRLSEALFEGDLDRFREILMLDIDRDLLRPVHFWRLYIKALERGGPMPLPALVDYGWKPSSLAFEKLLKVADDRVTSEQRLAFADLLLDAGVDPWPVLPEFLRRDARELIELIAQRLIYAPQGRDIQDVTPRELARDLLSRGAHPEHHAFLRADGSLDVNARDPKGYSGLHKVLEPQYRRLLLLYIEAGADIEAQDLSQRTALMLAAERGRTEAMALLRQHGASGEVSSSEYSSPSQAFWQGIGYSWFVAEGSSALVRLELPNSFTECRPSGAGILLTCTDRHGIRVGLSARQLHPFVSFIREVMKFEAPPPSRSEALVTGSNEITLSWVGEKGAFEFTMHVAGPTGLRPELELLAQDAWDGMMGRGSRVPRILRQLSYGIGGLAVVVLLIMWFQVRKRAAELRDW